MRFAAFLLSAAAFGEVTRLELVERLDYLDGRAFGPAGAYEIVRAKAFFAADPANAANKIVVDLALAPRNAQGRVEWSADVYVLKPRDSRLGNGTALYEVSNRGGRGLLAQFHREGEHLLLQQGFTLLWCGWQWDIPEMNMDGLRMYPPVATDNGKPIRGPVRAEFVPNARATTMPLGDRNHVAYPVVADAKLTVRATPDGERQPIPASAYRVSFNGQAIEMSAGFEPGRIYELVYTSENPLVAGLGPASVRDLVSFFKHGGGGNLLNAENRAIKRAIGFGTSQSGRFLRKFLYDGFNSDEKGRKVFDGVWAHVAGAGRGSFNHRFAQASRDGHPMMNFLYPSDLPPFTDEALRAKSKAQNVEPKIFYTDGSYEYWGRAAAMSHVAEDGSADAPLSPDSRRYYLAGTQHGAGRFPPARANTEHLANANDYRFAMRALLVALNAWITTGKQPPPSAYPSLAKGELVPFDKLKFAAAPTPKHPHAARRLDFGPEFESSGVVSKDPPAVLQTFPVLVPNVDSDGNEIAGIRLPQLAVPLATYTGWNYRTASIGAKGEIFDMVGSTFPFPKDRVAALYKDRDDYVAKTLAHGRALVKQGYALEEDLLEIVERAKEQWEKMPSLK